MKNNNFTTVFIILCFGYLIDYYDLSIFSVARMSILRDLNVPSDEIMSVSKLMFNAQALGIFVGGILSGVWGDKIGRVSAVRLGIFLYSTAIILSIFVTSVNLFTFLRFVAGVGLAGELAASITLLSEMSKQESRGFVASSVYFFGILGGILTTAIVSLFNWKILFLIGGVAGFIFLFLRKYLVDSTIFMTLKQNTLIPRGSLKLLLLNKPSLLKILRLTLCLIPFWLMVFFINFAPEIAEGIGLYEKINLAYCLFMFFVGSLLGTLLFIFLGKKLKSHKKPIFIGFATMFISIVLLCFIGQYSVELFSNLYILVGISTGYFGLYMMLLAENFGTNQRSTGTTLTSNFGRSSFILVNLFVPFVIQISNSTFFGSILSAFIIISVSCYCLVFTRETYSTSVDYNE